MSDVKVTREHRVLATQALNRFGTPGSDLQRWVETGDGYFPSLDDAAELFASVHRHIEYRIRDHVLECLKSIADTADIVDQGSPVLYVRVDSIESLIFELEAANG